MRHSTKLICSVLALAALLAPAAATAQEMPEDLVRAEILTGWRTDEGTRMAALHLTLAPGWKTYWRAPGEAGIPPRFDWSGSENLASVRFHWPRPGVFDINGFRVIAYENELVLPIELVPARLDAPMAVAARIDLGVCDLICVPVTLDVSADLRALSAADASISAALADLPETAEMARITQSTCSALPVDDGMRLTAAFTMPSIGPDEFAVVEFADESVWISPAKAHREGGALVAVADLVPANAQPFALDRSDLRFTIFGGNGRVVDLAGCAG